MILYIKSFLTNGYCLRLIYCLIGTNYHTHCIVSASKQIFKKNIEVPTYYLDKKLLLNYSFKT